LNPRNPEKAGREGLDWLCHPSMTEEPWCGFRYFLMDFSVHL
jgi:hypothetical protein